MAELEHNNDSILHLFKKLAKTRVDHVLKDTATDKIKEKYTNLLCSSFLNSWKWNARDVNDKVGATDYGAVWSSQILLEDIIHDLNIRGKLEAAEELSKNLDILEQENYDNLEEIFTFLLLSKSSDFPPDCQHPFTFSGEDFFIKPGNPYAFDNNILNFKTNSKDSTSFSKVISPNDLFLDHFIKKVNKKENSLYLSIKNESQQEVEKHIEEKTLASICQEPKSRTKSVELGPEIVFSKPEVFEVEYKRALQSEKGKKIQSKKEKNNVCGRTILLSKVNQGILHEISMSDYILHVKYLLCGVGTTYFRYSEENKRFSIHPGLYFPGITPECLAEFSVHLMEIGTNYHLLREAAENYVLMGTAGTGIIFKSLWENILQYLQDYCKQVAKLGLKSSLLSLREWTSEQHNILESLTEMCCLNNSKQNLPRGGALLNYIFNYSENLCDEFVRSPILQILANCCYTYFRKLLEVWIFRGELCNKYIDDFFVTINPELSNKMDRLRYLSFDTNKDNVPFFLNDIYDDILMCGKSSYLLRLFDSQNKLSHIYESKSYPSIKICLSDEDLSSLHSIFQWYYKKVIQQCGEPLSFSTIRENERFQKHERYQQIIAMQQEVKIERDRKKLEGLAEKKAQKVKRFYEIKAQMEEHNRKLMEQRKLDEEEDKKIREEAARIANIEKQVIEEEKNKMKNFFDQVMMDMEQNNSHDVVNHKAEENLISLLDEEGNIKEDSNLLLDEEGNIKNEIKIELLDIGGGKMKEESCNSILDVEGNIISQKTDDNHNESHHKYIQRKILAENNKRKVMSVTQEETVMKKVNKLQTEAEKIKQKVLGSEYNILSMDIENNLVNTRKLSVEAEKNKQKVLGTEYNNINSSHNNINGSHKTTLPISNPLTDREKNKMKIMGSEYDIITNLDILNNVKSPTDKELSEKIDETKCEENKGGIDQLENVKSTTKEGNERNEVEVKKEENVENLEILENVQEQESKVDNLCAADKKKDHTKFIREIIDLDYFNNFQALLQEGDIYPKLDFLEVDAHSFKKSIINSVKICLSVQERLLNQEILRHFFIKENYLSHIRSLQAYFFLRDGEFSRSLTSNLFTLLSKSSELRQFFDKSALSSILNEALHYSISNENAENVSFQILEVPNELLPASGNVLQPFQLSYAIKWPLNIVLTDRAIFKYRQVFHFLINLKRVHWTLNETFLHLKSLTKEFGSFSRALINSSQFHKLMIYRHGITLYIMLLEDHVCVNGIHQAWRDFMLSMESAHNLDHLYKKHVLYIKNVQRRCFLTKNAAHLLEIINKLCELGLLLHYTVKSVEWKYLDEEYIHPRFKEIKTIFDNFCCTTVEFHKALEKAVQRSDMKVHVPLMEQISLKFRL